MGEDDYKADLDAVNISFMMETQGISFELANQSYYQQIANNPSLRDEMFINKNGGIDSIISDIYECSALTTKTVGNIFTPQEKKLEHIKGHNQTGYNFLMNLIDGDGSYNEY